MRLMCFKVRLLAVSMALGAALSMGLPASGCGSDESSAGADSTVQPDSTTGDAAGLDVATMDAAAQDAGGGDAGTADAGNADAGQPDAGNLCGPNDVGACLDSALECLCCPAGGPMSNCLCTTACQSDVDCTDPARPHCNQENPNSPGICTTVSYPCAWGSVCAAPDTPIATPNGMRPMSSLKVGDLVYSLHEHSLQAVPLIRTSRTAVWGHSVRRVRLSNGAELHISPGHPSADGRYFAGLVAGDSLGHLRVTQIQDVPYPHPFTHDILPASDTGTYVAGGALIGSTLR